MRTSVSQDLKNIDIFYQIFKTVLLFSSWVCLGFNLMCYEERKHSCLHLAKYLNNPLFLWWFAIIYILYELAFVSKL